MSTNLVHVMTVIGKGAAEVEAACEELLGRRVERKPAVYGSDDWSAADHQAIARFCSSVINAAPALPIVYYAQYLDPWSVGDSRFWRLQWSDGRRRQIYGDPFGLVYYPSSFCRDLLAQIKACRRRKFYRTQSEDRWYLEQMKEALHSALWLDAPFLVVAISRCLGASRCDEEIRAALDFSMGFTAL